MTSIFNNDMNKKWIVGMAGLCGAGASLGLMPLGGGPALMMMSGGIYWASNAQNIRHTILIIGAMAWGWFGASLYWIANALLVEGGGQVLLLPIIALIFPIGMALFWAVPCYGLMRIFDMIFGQRYDQFEVKICLIILGIGGGEYLRGVILTGFPWNAPAHGMLNLLPAAQIAAFVGQYGLNLCVMGMTAAGACLIKQWRENRGENRGEKNPDNGGEKSRVKYVFLAVMLAMPMMGLSVMGGVRLINAPEFYGHGEADAIIRIVQPNIPQTEKWNPDKKSAHRQKMIRLVREHEQKQWGERDERGGHGEWGEHDERGGHGEWGEHDERGGHGEGGEHDERGGHDGHDERGEHDEHGGERDEHGGHGGLGDRGEWGGHDEHGEWGEHDERGERDEHGDRGERDEREEHGGYGERGEHGGLGERGERGGHDEHGEWGEHDEHGEGGEKKKFDLILLPEAAIADFWPKEEKLAAGLARAMLKPETILGVGMLSINAEHQFFNSVLFLDSNGNMIGKYDKQHLVPFGEYMPVLPLMQNRAHDISAGGKATNIPLPFGEARMLICYEVIFPNFIAHDDMRADLLLSVSNDAWFGMSLGPYQHFYQSRLRAIEEALPLYRAANTGISGGFDAFGRLLGKTQLGTEAVIDLPFSAQTKPSFFQKHRYLGVTILFLWFACLAFWLALRHKIQDNMT